MEGGASSSHPSSHYATIVNNLAQLDQSIQTHHESIEKCKTEKVRVIRGSGDCLWTIQCAPSNHIERWNGISRRVKRGQHTHGLFWTRNEATAMLKGCTTSQGWSCTWHYQVISISMKNLSDWELLNKPISPKYLGEFPHNDSPPDHGY